MEKEEKTQDDFEKDAERADDIRQEKPQPQETDTKTKVGGKTTLSKKVVDILQAPLPKEAVKPHPTRSYLSVISPAYVIERLNDAFGPGGWTFESWIVEAETQHIVVKVTLLVRDYDVMPITSFGGNDNADRGDAYKGAVTDALTKCASYLGVGLEVYKGLHDTQNGHAEEKKDDKKWTPRTPAQKSATDKQKELIKKLAAEKGRPVPDEEWFDALTMETAKGSIDKLLQTPSIANEIAEQEEK